MSAVNDLEAVNGLEAVNDLEVVNNFDEKGGGRYQESPGKGKEYTGMEQNQSRPFMLKPCGKDYLWGGNRLRTAYYKDLPEEPLAETWECSTHPEGISQVVSGVHRGLLLRDVLERHPEYLGTHPEYRDGLPILVKLIDAAENLSVQVHPDDAYAAAREGGSLGKTEMWYVLEAAPGAELVYGFVRDMDRETLQAALDQDSLEKYLQRVPVKKDDVFYIKAGTVHGIGAGIVLAEIQESSNLTYRFYDYHRKDKDGQERPLHVEKAMEVADLQAAASPRQPMRVLKYRPGCASELLCRCKYFQVERLLLNTRGKLLGAAYGTDATSFEVLLCVEGEGCLKESEDGLLKEEIRFQEEEHGQEHFLYFRKGDCIFVPANTEGLLLEGRAQLLKIHC